MPNFIANHESQVRCDHFPFCFLTTLVKNIGEHMVWRECYPWERYKLTVALRFSAPLDSQQKVSGRGGWLQYQGSCIYLLEIAMATIQYTAARTRAHNQLSVPIASQNQRVCMFKVPVIDYVSIIQDQTVCQHRYFAITFICSVMPSNEILKSNFGVVFFFHRALTCNFSVFECLKLEVHLVSTILCIVFYPFNAEFAIPSR